MTILRSASSHLLRFVLFPLALLLLSACNGGASNGIVKSGTQAAPIDVFTVSGADQVTLSWPPVAGTTAYNLYWGTAAGITTASTRINGVSSPYIQKGLRAGTTYYYRVSAVKKRGRDAFL